MHPQCIQLCCCTRWNRGCSSMSTRLFVTTGLSLSPHLLSMTRSSLAKVRTDLLHDSGMRLLNKALKVCAIKESKTNDVIHYIIKEVFWWVWGLQHCRTLFWICKNPPELCAVSIEEGLEEQVISWETCFIRSVHFPCNTFVHAEPGSPDLTDCSSLYGKCCGEWLVIFINDAALLWLLISNANSILRRKLCNFRDHKWLKVWVYCTKVTLYIMY